MGIRAADPHTANRPPRTPAARLAVAGLLVALPVMQARAQDGDEATIVTSDTAVYCVELAEELGNRADAPERVLALGSEGRELCAQGHVRAGIFRVRRAWVLLRQGEPSGR